MTPRKAIREWMQTTIANNTAAEERVFLNRRVPIPEDATYPLILIYGGQNETAEDSNVSEYRYTRDYQLIVDIRTNGDGLTTDDDLDEIAEQVELLMENPEYGEEFSTFGYEGFDLEVDTEGETDLGSLKLKFSFKYLR